MQGSAPTPAGGPAGVVDSDTSQPQALVTGENVLAALAGNLRALTGFGRLRSGKTDRAADRGGTAMKRSSDKEIQRIDATLRILVRHRRRATDPAEIWRCTDVIDMHLDERLTHMRDPIRQLQPERS